MEDSQHITWIEKNLAICSSRNLWRIHSVWVNTMAQMSICSSRNLWRIHSKVYEGKINPTICSSRNLWRIHSFCLISNFSYMICSSRNLWRIHSATIIVSPGMFICSSRNLWRIHSYLESVYEDYKSAVAEIYGGFTADLSHQTIYQCDRRKICCKKCIFNNTKHNQKFIFFEHFCP